MFCGSCPNGEDSPRKSKYLFEDGNEDFWKGFFFGIVYGMALSAVILLR